MRWIHTPPMDQLGDATRAVYRSRHLFIMLGALANLALGNSTGTGLDRVISVLVLGAPALLIAGFFTEPEHGIYGGPWSQIGLYLLFAAAALLVVRRFRERS